MKKPILLISNVEIIEVEDNGNSVIECVKECHGDLFPIGPADMPVIKQMNREVEFADVHTFERWEELLTANPHIKETKKTITKIAMTREIQEKLGEPFATINEQSKLLSELSNLTCNQAHELKMITKENVDLQVKLYDINHMSVWQRVKFAFVGKV